MQIVRTENYRDTLRPQPWHQKLEETKALFESRYHQDITSKEGFDAVMAVEGWRDQYNDSVASLVTGDNGMSELVKKIGRHSMEDVRNPFVISSEATDSLANNANYSALAKLNSWIIVGYTARSKCLELYRTVSTDDPTLSFKYNISYIKKGTDPEEYIRPNADRDGDLGPLYDLPVIAPAITQVGEDGFDHLEVKSGINYNGKNDVWIKIVPGIMGNLFKDNAGEFDPTKYTLEKNPTIVGVFYHIEGADEEDGHIKTYSERKENTGEQQKKNFYAPISIPYTIDEGAVQKSVDAVILGVIDLDNGDYQFSAIGPITHIQLDVRVTNVGNELGTIRAGNRQVIESFSVDNHPYGTVPVVPEMSDDFNAGGSGVSATAFFVDQVTSGLASMRDMVMERDLDISYEKGPKNHNLYPKLGGFRGNISFPLAARLPGGSDPFSWMTIGLKNTIIQHFSLADMLCYFEETIDRQWYILGSEYDINRVPNFTYSDWDGKEAGGQAEKYGFNLDTGASFMDSKQRTVRIIGSSYKRHYQDKQGRRLPMRAVLKSTSLEQPTTVYVPYSFRVYAGIMTETSKRTGLIIAARDCIRSLSCVQSRITLVNNDDNLYSAICSWDSGNNQGTTGPGSSMDNPIFTKAVAGGAKQDVNIASVDAGVKFPNV
jgi:hypothetical protein